MTTDDVSSCAADRQRSRLAGTAGSRIHSWRQVFPEGGLRPRINEFTWSENEEDLNSAHLQMVHHSKLLLPSAVQRILEEIGCQCQEYEWPDYWYFGKERLLIRPGDQVTSALMMLMLL